MPGGVMVPANRVLHSLHLRGQARFYGLYTPCSACLTIRPCRASGGSLLVAYNTGTTTMISRVANMRPARMVTAMEPRRRHFAGQDDGRPQSPATPRGCFRTKRLFVLTGQRTETAIPLNDGARDLLCAFPLAVR